MRALLSAAALLGAALMSGAAPLAAQQVPTGFVHEIVAPSVPGCIDIDFLPDGRLVYISQNGPVGAVVPVTPGQSAVVAMGAIANPVISYSRGLIALAVDPLWPHRPHLWIWHTDATTRAHQLTRFEVTGDLQDPASTNLTLGAGYTVLQLPDNHREHNGAFLEFDSRGRLYLGTGDDRVPCDAQDPTSWNGKILRLDVSGLPATGPLPDPATMHVPGNVGTTGNAAIVWALGTRNPFRGHIDPLTDAVFVADVGEDAFDEIDVVRTDGANLGWPWLEGSAPYQTCAGTAPVTPLTPVFEMPLPGTTFRALISLGVYRNRAGAPFNLGPDYEGDFLFVDHFVGDVRRLTETNGTWSIAAPVPGQPAPTFWATGLQYAVAGAIGPDGAFYWVERQISAFGSIHRIRAASTTGPSFGYLGRGCSDGPRLGITGTPPQVGAPLTVEVTGLTGPSGFAALILGFDSLSWAGGPLPQELTVFGIGGAGTGTGNCLGHVRPDTWYPMARSGSALNWSTTVPNDPALAGLPFYVQGVVSSGPGSLTLSDAGGGVIGS